LKIKFRILYVIVILLLTSCFKREKGKNYWKHVVSVEYLLNENNQLKLTNSLSHLDSCFFADYGDRWTKKEPLTGIGYLDNRIFRIQVILKRNFESETYWDFEVKKIIEDEIKDIKTKNDLVKINFDSVINLNTDSLSLKSRGEPYRSVSHADYAIIASIKKRKFTIVDLYDAKSYQNSVPTAERFEFLKTIEEFKRIITN
jgi:hypothetical protein